MDSRRTFLKKGMAGVASLPFITTTTGYQYALDNLSPATVGSEKDYWKMVRRQFPLKEGQTYFNNGTIGPTSGYVLNKMMDHMMHNNTHAAEVDYSNGSGPELLTGYFKYEEIRKKIGVIINADFKSIALTQNATFGMNYVANGLDLAKGDELLNTNQEHGGGFGAWQLMAKRKGCIYKQAEMPVPANDPQQIFDVIFSQVTNKTRVIAIPHIVSVYGTVLPVEAICQEAKKRGIFTILDGAQCVGQVKVDVQKIGCDAYYSSLHKWLLSPPGSGILYINPDRISEVWSTIASYNWDNQEDHGFRLMQNGTGNPALMEGFDASLDFFNTIGADRWINRIKELGDYLRDGLQKMDRITIHSSTTSTMCAGITTYGLAGFTGPELQKSLWEKAKLQPRAVGEEFIRHSVHIYNNEEEIDKTLEVMNSL